MFTCSKWNHVAIESDGYVWESVGKGVIKTPYNQWLKVSDRIVLPLKPSKPADTAILKSLEGKPYGFLDLLQIALYIIRSRWFATGNDWNGKDGTKEGWFCSELAAKVLGIEKYWLVMPCDFEYLPDLSRCFEYRTYKA